MLWTTFGEHDQAKEIKVDYLVIKAPSSYILIIGQPTFKQLGTALLTMYLCMKYPARNGRVGVIQGDQETPRKCYVESLKLKKGLHYTRERWESRLRNKAEKRNLQGRRGSPCN